ncbi:MAG: YeeE/YedE thiosulfate transporter family protein [Bacillota bacterium]
MKERGIPKLSLGLITGIIFGFLLQKGGVTDYNVLIGQLLLKDFTVIKIIITAIITGMIGIYFLNDRGYVNLHPKSGSLGSVVIGGLLFGIGFGLLGYCPGTVAGAVGQGALDALFGGVIGMIIGAGAFAHVYPFVKKRFLNYGKFEKITIPEVIQIDKWKIIAFFSGGLVLVLILIELMGY